MDISINPPPVSFREIFEVKLSEYEQQNQGSQRKPWTTERVLEIMNNVRKARALMVSNQDMTFMDYYWISNYDIMVTAFEEFLIFKKKSPDEPTVRIIPRNQYFSTLDNIHKECSHGGRDEMLQAIKSKYHIPRKAIEIFLALCPTCETQKALAKKGIDTNTIFSQDFNIRGQVDLLDYQSCPDGEYMWLLNYQDNATKFVSLRPLKTKREQEVAMELMKIFMIFGAPYILQSDNGREFAAKIIEELISMWPECKIVHGSLRHPETQESVERSNQDVENMLRTWMNDNNSTNWSIGCHHVQYKKNASIHRTIGSSPYKALFGCNPKAGLKDSVMPILILNNVRTEEQLQKLLQKEFSSKINLVDSAIKTENVEIPEQIESHQNIKLEPCSKKLCENSVPAICGLSDEEHESYNLKDLFLIKPDTKSEQDVTLKGTNRVAKMLNCSRNKLIPLTLGFPVDISVPKEDRGPWDTEYITGNIVDIQYGLFKVGTKSGKIKNWFRRHEIELSSTFHDFESIPDIPISLREAVTRECLFEGPRFHKCICKPAQKQCRTSQCACFKKNMLCGSKCHDSLTCANIG